MSMLVTAAAVFHAPGLTEVGNDLDEVDHALGRVPGGVARGVFGLALLASGIASSTVGTMAGQIVMQGFIRRRIPLCLRRGITMVPALTVIATGPKRPRC